MKGCSWDNAFNKVASFFTYGGTSGKELKNISEEMEVATSYDTQSTGSLSLNCITKTDGIAISLFKKPANSGFSVISEEIKGSNGLVDNAYFKLEKEINEYKNKISMLISDPISQKQACLKNVIGEDEEFLKGLSEKTHQSVLFIFDIDPEKNELISMNGCKETRRMNVSSKNIKYVLIPERYKQYFDERTNENVDKEKFIYVKDSQEKIAFSYREGNDVIGCEELKGVTSIPDYKGALNQIVEKEQRNLNTKPLFTHMTRLPNDN